jgi:hypothetical protein
MLFDILPARNGIVIVSLLGKKPDNLSEYDFYTFRGDQDALTYPERLPFRDWLCREFPNRQLDLKEFPTTDFQCIPANTLSAISECVNEHLQRGRTVVLFDSGGEQRTGQVCRSHMGFVEDTTWRPEAS